MADSPKVEARLGELMETALGLYMRDRHLQNESEVLRSALGKFLDEEGYMALAARQLGLRTAEDDPDSKKKSEGDVIPAGPRHRVLYEEVEDGGNRSGRRGKRSSKSRAGDKRSRSKPKSRAVRGSS